MQIRKTNRMSSFDYSNKGGYFLTICCHNKMDFFGEVINNIMELNDFGRIAAECWNQIPKHFENCNLDEFIVMPNHIHGIIFFEGESAMNKGAMNRHASSLHETSETDIRQNQKVPVIIASFKSAVSKFIHLEGNKGFKWQKSYYDRIIRDNDELINIRQYIIDNPKNWEKDNKGQNENIML